MQTASLESRSVKPAATPFAKKSKSSVGSFEEFSKDEIKEAEKKAVPKG